MTITTALTTSVFVALLLVITRKLAPKPTDVVALFGIVTSLLYGLRALILVSGLDQPYPAELFNKSIVISSIDWALTWLCIYLTVFAVGYLLTSTASQQRIELPIFLNHVPSLRRLMNLSLTLTGLAAILSLALVLAFGGVDEIIRSAKVGKDLAGLYPLRIFPAVGAVVSVAAFVDTIRGPRRVDLAVTALGCSAANAFFVFLWGSRSAAVVVAAIALLGASEPRQRAKRRTTTSITYVLLAALVVVGAAAGLRVARANLLRGGINDVYAEATIWRQVSLATNAIYFDATVLAFRDWPERFEYRNGRDFANGVLGLVPRAVWEGKPDAIAPGSWFRQVYQPEISNGWPVGAPTLWYLNWGHLGLIIGGLLAGAAYSVAASAQRRAPPCGFNLAVAVVFTVHVFQLGINSQTPLKIVVWLVPLWLAAKYLSRPSEPTTRHKRATMAKEAISLRR